MDKTDSLLFAGMRGGEGGGEDIDFGMQGCSLKCIN